jgi:hypothetical protein
MISATSTMACINCPNNGVIWTTRDDCGDIKKDINHFLPGDTVYINGKNFDAHQYNWTITGKPGSCDSNTIIATGLKRVDNTGRFCIKAYVVQPDDCGEYSADFAGKKDNYNVDTNPPVVPEFGPIIALTTVLGALGTFFIIRKK